MESGICQGRPKARVNSNEKTDFPSSKAQAAVAKLSLQDKVNLATGMSATIRMM